eukprot:PhM_4_TR510/c0_g1_i1/m.55522
MSVLKKIICFVTFSTVTLFFLSSGTSDVSDDVGSHPKASLSAAPHVASPETSKQEAPMRASASSSLGIAAVRDAIQKDESLSTRCPCAVTDRNVPHPPESLEDAAAVLPSGATARIRTMTVRGDTSRDSQFVSTQHKHHPIFDKYVAKLRELGDGEAKVDRYKKYISEFTKVWVKDSYDCDPDVDFRKYHLSRAVACQQKEQHNDTELLLPISDEEYYEHIALLTTAYDAASKGERYVVIELGARYGTWAVRGGAAYRMMAKDGNSDNFLSVALEADCPWFCHMQDHVAANGMTAQSALVLAYSAPRSYNKVDMGNPATYKSARTVSLLDLLERLDVVHLIDSDIQGWESISVETEPKVMTALTEKVKWVHYGTHGVKVERTLIKTYEAHGWCTLYYFAGSHHKGLNRGHFCTTPFGTIGYNDGALGFLNPKFYSKNFVCPGRVFHRKAVTTRCYSTDAVLGVILSD